MPSPFLLHLINGALGSKVLLSLAIIVGTFILEDPTTVLVGVLAADGVISIPLAMFSLYVGVVLGDIAFYWIGRLASTHPRLERYVDHEHVVLFRTWIESRYILTIFSARFIPGSRLPTYAASGFIRSPFSTFVATTIVAASIWTTVLFCLAYWFGSVTAQWLHNERWVIASVFVLLLFFAGRYNVRTLKKIKKSGEPSNPSQ